MFYGCTCIMHVFVVSEINNYYYYLLCNTYEHYTSIFCLKQETPPPWAFKWITVLLYEAVLALAVYGVWPLNDVTPWQEELNDLMVILVSSQDEGGDIRGILILLFGAEKRIFLPYWFDLKSDLFPCSGLFRSQNVLVGGNETEGVLLILCTFLFRNITCLQSNVNAK